MMFARDYLTIVSRWARQQLREGAETPEQGRKLRQLIEAADALGAQLEPVQEPAHNVVQLADHRRRAS